MDKKRPIRSFRAGQVDCALWQDNVTVKGEQQTILKASVSRSYKDQYGNWKSSQSFSRNEIPLATYVLQKAFEAMIEKSTVIFCQAYVPAQPPQLLLGTGELI